MYNDVTVTKIHYRITHNYLIFVTVFIYRSNHVEFREMIDARLVDVVHNMSLCVRVAGDGLCLLFCVNICQIHWSVGGNTMRINLDGLPTRRLLGDVVTAVPVGASPT